MADGSVDLIICDPPYYRIKGEFDFIWRTFDAYLEWCREWIRECARVLKLNGSMYIYGVDLGLDAIAYTVYRETELVYRNRVTFTKSSSYIINLYGGQGHFRQYVPTAEHALFYTFQDDSGLERIKHDTDNFTELRDYFRNLQHVIGLTKKMIIDVVGQRADHCFRHSSAQWDLPTEDTYTAVIALLPKDTVADVGDFRPRPYGEIKARYWAYRDEYEGKRLDLESQRYTFNGGDGVPNVIPFEPDRGAAKTAHPTQKPLSISQKLVEYSSNPGDTVLVPFAGSGSECLAALKLGRKFIGFEVDARYVEIANARLQALAGTEAVAA